MMATLPRERERERGLSFEREKENRGERWRDGGGVRSKGVGSQSGGC